MTVSPIASTIDPALAPPELTSAPAEAVATILEPLKLRATWASAWTATEYVAVQVLRLLSTMILTRLLDLGVLGLMVMVSVFFNGLQMFSDVGTGPSLIQNKRGTAPEFYNTAWTMQIGRGFLLWGLSIVLAWPASVWFHEPALMWLIPLCGVGSVISGFNSTSLVFLNRHLQIRKLTILEVVGQVVTISVTVGWILLVNQTIWALVAGSFTDVIFRLVVSHFLIPGHRNRITWNADAAREILRFGRWIFVATALTFFAMYTDQLLVGRLMGAATLVVYAYAITFAGMPTQFMKKIAAQVVFPLLSETMRERPEAFYHRLRVVRIGLVMIGFGLLLPLLFFGPLLIDLLYPPVVHRAGWMLQVLAAGSLGGVITTAYGGALLARGNSFAPMLLLATQLVLLAVVPLLGYFRYGDDGLIIALASIEWLLYPAAALVMARQRLWQPEVDFPAIALAFGAMLIAFVVL
jgi:O-antigen/teichoic acid export membrane protein